MPIGHRIIRGRVRRDSLAAARRRGLLAQDGVELILDAQLFLLQRLDLGMDAAGIMTLQRLDLVIQFVVLLEQTQEPVVGAFALQAGDQLAVFREHRFSFCFDDTGKS